MWEGLRWGQGHYVQERAHAWTLHAVPTMHTRAQGRPALQACAHSLTLDTRWGNSTCQQTQGGGAFREGLGRPPAPAPLRGAAWSRGGGEQVRWELPSWYLLCAGPWLRCRKGPASQMQPEPPRVPSRPELLFPCPRSWGWAPG